MTENHINFTTEDGIIIEGLLCEGASDHGVVITHPHPLYGGDMRNIVVETIVNAYRAKGQTTLRFNFRGVGKSGGSYDDGCGEQKDVVAAFTFLKEKGLKRIDLAGYSFGAWVIAQMTNRVPADAVIMVSPPAAMMAFDSGKPISNLTLAVTGSADEFAPPDLVKQLVLQLNPAAAFEVIDGADHFFYGFTDKLSEIIQKSVETHSSA